jgi:hypothetical protein
MFYENRITDGEIISKRQLEPVLAKLETKFKRVVFFDLARSTESGEFKMSKLNEMESEWTFTLLDYFAEISMQDVTVF